MTNVLIEGYSHIPSYDLSVFDFERLSSDMKINVRCRLSREITSADLSWADILLCIRADNPLSLHLARKAKNSGRKVILSLDDDLLEYHKHDSALVNKWYSHSLQEVISLSDILLTTSRYLGEKIKERFGISYMLSDTTVEASEIKEKKSEKGRIGLLYAAGKGHKIFFDRLIRPILNDLYSKYKDGIELTVIGPDIETEGIMLPINKVESMPMTEYNSYMQSHDFDIGLAPLFDFELGRSKYFNKYLEYTRNQMCGIYSNVLPYTLVINNGENGLLVDNEPDNWYKAICRLIEDDELRNRCIRKAKEHVLSEYSRKNNINKLVSGFPEFNTFVADHHVKVSCPFMYLRFIFFESLRRLVKKFA